MEVVVRHERDRVVEVCTALDAGLVIADQDDVKGTGRAVECGLTRASRTSAGPCSSRRARAAAHRRDPRRAHRGPPSPAARSPSSPPTSGTRPGTAGWCDAEGQVERIVEHKDATDAERALTEINSGIYAFDAARGARPVGTDNVQGEKYLTDVVAIARTSGRPRAHVVDDLWQTEGVNDRVQLAALGRELNRRVCEAHMRAGVTIVDPATTWIDVDVSIGQDATVLPGTQLLGATSIGMPSSAPR